MMGWDPKRLTTAVGFRPPPWLSVRLLQQSSDDQKNSNGGGGFSSSSSAASIHERIDGNLSSRWHRVSSFGEPNPGRWGLLL
jgi:hypothetical protein